MLFLNSCEIMKMSPMFSLLWTPDILLFMWFTKVGMVGGHVVRASDSSQSVP